MVNKDAVPPGDQRRWQIGRGLGLADIFVSHNRPYDKNSMKFWMHPGDGVLLKGFFDEVDVTPASNFGQYTQLYIAERRIAEKRIPPNQTDKRAFLEAVRALRKEIGKKIFGEDEPNYAQRVYEVVTRYSGAQQNNARHEARTQARRELVQEVQDKFPLTFR